MGIDYYMLCDERRDLFSLNRGDWLSVMELMGGDPPPKDVFALEVLRVWMERYDDEVAEEYALAVGRTLWDWCDERSWEVRLISDWMDDLPKDWNDWPITGSTDNVEPEARAELSVSQRRELDALLGERRAVLGVVSDLRRYRAAAQKFLDVWTRWNSSGCWSGPDATAAFVREVDAIEAGRDSEE